MSALEVARAVAGRVADNAIDASLLAVCVAGCLALFGRFLAPRFRYLLWALVAVRLCLPTLPSDPWKGELHRLVAERTSRDPEPAPTTEPGAVDPTGPPPVPPLPGPPLPASTRVLPPPRAKHEVELLAQDPGSEPSTPSANVPALSLDLPSVLHAEHPTRPAEAAPPTPRLPRWQDLLLSLWLAGAVFAAALVTIRERRFRRRLAREPRVDDAAVLAEWRQICRESGIGREVALVRSHLVESPCATGLVHPMVLVPESLWDTIDVRSRHHVLRHELAHLRHGDVLLQCVLVLLDVVYWFHPVWWWSRSRLLSAQEMVRDAEALERATDADRRAYARTLLHLLDVSPPGVTSPLGTRFRGARHELRRRILMMQCHGGSKTGARILSGALVLFCAWIGGTKAARPALAGTAAQPEGASPATDPGAPASPATLPSRPDTPHLVVQCEDGPLFTPALRAALDRTVELQSSELSLRDAVQFLRTAAKAEILLDPELEMSIDVDSPVRLPAGKFALRDALRLLEHVYGTKVAPRGSLLVVCADLSSDFSMRIYDLAPLLTAADRDPESVAAEIADLGQQLFAFADIGGRLLGSRFVVTSTETGHALLLDLYQKLLAHETGTTPIERMPDLGRSVSLDFESVECLDAFQRVQEILGVPLVPTSVARDSMMGNGATVSLQCQDLPLRDAIAWICRSAGSLWIEPAPWGLSLRSDDDYRPTLQLYDVHALLNAEDPDSSLYELVDLLQGSLQDSCLATWHGAILLFGPTCDHHRTHTLLDMLRRSMADGASAELR